LGAAAGRFILHHCEAALSVHKSNNRAAGRRAASGSRPSLAVPEIALPDEEDLRDAAAAVGLITAGTAGLTIGTESSFGKTAE